MVADDFGAVLNTGAALLETQASTRQLGGGASLLRSIYLRMNLNG